MMVSAVSKVFIEDHCTENFISASQMVRGVTSLSMDDYYCGVRKFGLSIVWFRRRKPVFGAQNRAQMMQRQETYLTNQTTNAFR